MEGVNAAVSQTFAPQGGAPEASVASRCMEEIGALTLPQLRWIFSSFSDDELIGDGWDPNSISNSDGDPTTHLWSEISAACEPVEIVIAGPPVDSEAARLFKELVFGEKTSEAFDVDRRGSFFSPQDNNELAQFLATNDTAAIAYFDVRLLLPT